MKVVEAPPTEKCFFGFPSWPYQCGKIRAASVPRTGTHATVASVDALTCENSFMLQQLAAGVQHCGREQPSCSTRAGKPLWTLDKSLPTPAASVMAEKARGTWEREQPHAVSEADRTLLTPTATSSSSSSSTTDDDGQGHLGGRSASCGERSKA
jgi:hypothetical protein